MKETQSYIPVETKRAHIVRSGSISDQTRKILKELELKYGA